MAYEMEQLTERYEDTPLTNFPVGEDSFSRMTDITISLIPLVIEYNRYYQAGDITSAANLLKNNPDLEACLFNADKFNQFRDALIAMQRFLLTQVDELYQYVAQSAIGINDNPTAEEAKVVAYSAEKVQSLFSTTEITLPVDGWSDTAPYEQTVAVVGMRESYEPHIACMGDVETESEKKILQKSWNFVDKIVTHDNSITAYCNFKKPLVDLPLVIKGV